MNNIIKNIFYLFLPIILGGLTGFIISDFIDYELLIKPPLSPPKILFPIAWSIIYILMGISYYLLKKNNKNTKIESIIYYIQLTINILWSIIFFILKTRLFATIWIILLDIIVIYMLYIFYKKEKLSTYFNLPYLIWILFATYLTIGFYILN